MLATLVDAPFDKRGWLFETKWDGCRAIAYKGKTLALLSAAIDLITRVFPKSPTI